MRKVQARGGGDAACSETGGGSCNPGEIQLLPVSPLRRHLPRSPAAPEQMRWRRAAAAAAATATNVNPGIGSGSGERGAVTAIRRRFVHALGTDPGKQGQGSKCRTLSPISDGSEGKGICLLVSSWLDLAGAAHQRWSCLRVGVGGRRRRAARRDDFFPLY
jgi:hypothetical protein